MAKIWTSASGNNKSGQQGVASAAASATVAATTSTGTTAHQRQISSLQLCGIAPKSAFRTHHLTATQPTCIRLPICRQLRLPLGAACCRQIAEGPGNSDTSSTCLENRPKLFIVKARQSTHPQANQRVRLPLRDPVWQYPQTESAAQLTRLPICTGPLDRDHVCVRDFPVHPNVLQTSFPLHPSGSSPCHRSRAKAKSELRQWHVVIRAGQCKPPAQRPPWQQYCRRPRSCVVCEQQDQ